MTLLVAGISSATINIIIDIDNKAVTPNDTFSVFSPVDEYGVKNPRIVTIVIIVEGIIRLFEV